MTVEAFLNKVNSTVGYSNKVDRKKTLVIDIDKIEDKTKDENCCLK